MPATNDPDWKAEWIERQDVGAYTILEFYGYQDCVFTIVNRSKDEYIGKSHYHWAMSLSPK